MLELSDNMLWIQSMPRVPYVYLWMPTGWIGLGMTISVYVHMPLGRAYFKSRSVKKNTLVLNGGSTQENGSIPFLDTLVTPEADFPYPLQCTASPLIMTNTYSGIVTIILLLSIVS